MIGDFGVPIAILVMVLVDYSIEDTYTQVQRRAVVRGCGAPGPRTRAAAKPGRHQASPTQFWTTEVLSDSGALGENPLASSSFSWLQEFSGLRGLLLSPFLVCKE